MTRDWFPEKGERAERAPDVPERGGMHWTCEHPPLGMGSARDAQRTSPRSGGDVSDRSRLADGSRLLASKVRRRAASSDVAGKGSD